MDHVPWHERQAEHMNGIARAQQAKQNQHIGKHFYFHNAYDENWSAKALALAKQNRVQYGDIPMVHGMRRDPITGKDHYVQAVLASEFSAYYWFIMYMSLQ